MVDAANTTDSGLIETTETQLPEHLAFARELQELAKKSVEGDKKSYKLFLQKVTPHIRRYVRKQWWGDNYSDEDLVQDVLIAVHTHLHTYNTDRPILPWLRSIVTYKVADFLRKFSRWGANEVSSEDIETFSAVGANNHYESLENIDYIERALESLPEKQAHVARMLKVNGLSLKEVADQTGLSVAAIKTYAHRAYKKMVQFRKENE